MHADTLPSQHYTRVRISETSSSRPIWWGLAVFVSLCVTSAQGQLRFESTRGSVASYSHSTSAGETIVLKVLINHLLELLNPVQAEVLSQSETLEDIASTLINSYESSSVNSQLTAVQISDGIDDCSEALSILSDPNAEILISPELATDLEETVSYLLEDLENVS